eukprot:635938-Pleurochrysis_carterae.AAC.1
MQLDRVRSFTGFMCLITTSKAVITTVCTTFWSAMFRSSPAHLSRRSLVAAAASISLYVCRTCVSFTGKTGRIIRSTSVSGCGAIERQIPSISLVTGSPHLTEVSSSSTSTTSRHSRAGMLVSFEPKCFLGGERTALKSAV